MPIDYRFILDVYVSAAIFCLTLVEVAMSPEISGKSRLRFSLRTLIVVVVVIGGGLGWAVHQARVQREAVVAIERAGGWSAYDWEWKDRDKIPNGQPWGPNWLVNLVGVDYFGRVVVVVLPEAGSDPVLASVGDLSRVEQMNLSFSTVTDAGAAHLKRLTHLKWLSLNGSQVTDAGVAHLEGLKSLELLGLGDTKITDQGLSHLKGLTRLEELSLDDTAVTDAGLPYLKGLDNLRELRLAGTGISDAGLVHFTGLTKLKLLLMTRTSVTDAGVQKLKRSLPNAKIYCR